MINLNNKYNNRIYYFNPILSCLVSSSSKRKIRKKITNLPFKVQKSLKLIENPFLVKKTSSRKSSLSQKNWIKNYARFLVLLYKHFPQLLFLLAKLRLNIFEDTIEAVDFFVEIFPLNQNLLCLPRSIFAITLSKSFDQEGVMFLGIFHPTKHMHAWILEKDMNSFRNDYGWTNYTPIAVFD